MITCCKDCVPPKRHFCCWDTCPEYKAEKARDLKKKQVEKKARAEENALTGERIRAIKKIMREGRRHK